MKKFGKKLAVVLSIVIVVVIVVNVIVYAASGKNVWEYFFGDSKQQDMSYLMESYGDSVTIDEYTVTLDSAIFDDKAEAAYCMFRISKEGGKVEASIDKDGTVSDSVGGRFSFCIDADTGGSGALEGEYDGDNLLIYAKFNYDCTVTKDAHTVYLFDSKNQQIYFENAAYKFKLKPTTKSVELEADDDISIIISPIAIKINAERALTVKTIEVIYSDGNTEEIVNVEKNIGTGGSGISVIDGVYNYSYVPYDLINIDNIEGIIYNGEKIMK